MSDKEITVEEMVNHLIRLNRLAGWTERCPTCEAIRKHLMDSDIVHWMDRCHELEEMLTEKPVAVSREWIENKVDERHKQHDERGYFDPMLREIRIKDFIETLTELDIEVSDNSEVSRRTSDKEGE